MESVKLFYLYSVILLSLQKSLSEFQNILCKIFVLTYSKYQSFNTRHCYQYTTSKFKDFKILEIYNKNEIVQIEKDLKNTPLIQDKSTLNYEECKDVLNYIKCIFTEAKRYILKDEEQDNEGNVFYNEDFCKTLIKLCAQFVVWTKVMITDVSNSDIVDNFTTLIDNYKINFECHLQSKGDLKKNSS